MDLSDKDLFDKCRHDQRAQALKDAGDFPYFRTVTVHRGPWASVEGREVLMIGSNDYLGLTHDPRVVEAARAATARWGSSCTGSRLLNGTLELHEELEHRLARFLGTAAAVVFASGFHANLAVVSTLAGKDDVVFCDRQNHASILDGCRLSNAKVRKFRHRDLGHLERLLLACPPRAGKLIAVEGVYSTHGALSDLPAVVDLARRHGARLLVDDAHGIGALGRSGRGTLEHFDCLGEAGGVDLVMGTFSKSLAGLGGFVAGPREVVDYLRHTARAMIFSASLSPGLVATALKSLEILEAEPWRLVRLHEIVGRVRSALEEMGFDTLGSRSHILPVRTGSDRETCAFWRRLFDRGLFANAIIAPATPPGEGLIRTSYMATQTDEDVDRVLEVFAELAVCAGAGRSVSAAG